MTDLITLDDYKLYQRKTDAAGDERLQPIITGVSQAVKNYCGRTFIDYYNTDKVEMFTIPNGNVSKLFLDEIPVVSITSIKERTSLADGWTTLVADGTGGKYEYAVSKEMGIVTRISATSTLTWPEGPDRVEVTYKAGFAAVPDDLVLALYDLVMYYDKREYIPRQSVQSTSRDRNTSSSIDGQASFPDHITRILDLYKIEDL